jgi:hypothetical protein
MRGRRGRPPSDKAVTWIEFNDGKGGELNEPIAGGPFWDSYY